MSNLQYGLPAKPAGTDLDRDILVTEDGGTYIVVSGPTVEPAGLLDHSASEGNEVSPKRGIADYVRASENIEAGDLLMPAADGEVAVYDDTSAGNVCIGRAGSDADDGDLVRVEFAAIYEIATE